MKAKITITWLTGLLTLTLTVFSFILSFNALTDLAEQHGFSIPYLFPLIVEFAVVIFSLNALYRSLYGESAKVQWGLIISSSVLAGIFNIAHAQAGTVSRLMAAMPSLFLLLSFESFLSLVKHSVTRQAIIDGLSQLKAERDSVGADLDRQRQQAAAELDRMTEEFDTRRQAQAAELDKLTGQIEQAQGRLETIRQDIRTAQTETKAGNVQELNAARQAKIDERRTEVLSLLRQGQDEKDIAESLAVSVRTIKRDIEALNGQVGGDK